MRPIFVILVVALGLAGAGREAAAQTVASGHSAGPLTRAFDDTIKRESSMQLVRYPAPHSGSVLLRHSAVAAAARLLRSKPRASSAGSARPSASSCDRQA
jgi:hypothetical protein